MVPHHRQRIWLRCLLFSLVLMALISAPASAAGAEMRFTILHTNDEHSALWPGPALDYAPGRADTTTGGFARLAGVLERERDARSGQPVLTVNAGDFFSGSPFSWVALEGMAPELTLMDQMGYDVITVGNHEWDFGPEFLAQYLDAAGVSRPDAPAILATNAVIPAGHPMESSVVRETHVLEIGADHGWERTLRIGFMGILGDAAITVAPEAAPVTFSDPVDSAREAAARLREDGVDIVIALTHSGVEGDRRLARQVEDIDLIVGGHSHTPLFEPELVSGIPIVQAGSRTEYLGCVELAYDPATGGIGLVNDEGDIPYLIPVGGADPECPDTVEAIAGYADALNSYLGRLTNGDYVDAFAPLASLDEPLLATPEEREHAMGNLVTDAFRDAGERILGEEVHMAFQASGQIRGDLRPAGGDGVEGAIAIYDLLEQVGLGRGPDLHPGAPLVGMYFTGADVLKLLEISQILNEVLGHSFFLQVSGLRVEYDPQRAILLWLPIVDLPVPTYRSVLGAEVVDARGSVETLSASDEDLYLVVGDFYVASFLPQVGGMLPRLDVIPRDVDGVPLADLEDGILRDSDGNETKAWRAVVDYAASFDPGPTGLPHIVAPEVGDRLVYRGTMPIILPPILGLLAVSAIALVAFRRFRRR